MRRLSGTDARRHLRKALVSWSRASLSRSHCRLRKALVSRSTRKSTLSAAGTQLHLRTARELSLRGQTRCRPVEEWHGLASEQRTTKASGMPSHGESICK